MCCTDIANLLRTLLTDNGGEGALNVDPMPRCGIESWRGGGVRQSRREITGACVYFVK